MHKYYDHVRCSNTHLSTTAKCEKLTVFSQCHLPIITVNTVTDHVSYIIAIVLKLQQLYRATVVVSCVSSELVAEATAWPTDGASSVR